MPESMSKAEREKFYTDFLTTEGYLPEKEMDDFVGFRKGNMGFVIPVDDDVDYVSIMSPFLEIKPDTDVAKAIHVGHEVMATTKVAKVYIAENTVWVAVEILCRPPEALKSVFGRCMVSLEWAAEQFQERMKA